VRFQPPPPRELPAQDHAALDRAERAARQLTWALAAVAGLVALLVICGLAGGTVLSVLSTVLDTG
jgi:hypothetical protein